MDLKKVDELVRMKGNCTATVDVLTIELLSTIASNTSIIVKLLQGENLSKDENQMELSFEQEEVKEPAPKKKTAPKKVEKPIEFKIEPIPVAEKELPTRDEVMEKLVAFIQDNGEEALANIFKELGGYANFPAVPQEKYPELLNKIA